MSKVLVIQNQPVRLQLMLLIFLNFYFSVRSINSSAARHSMSMSHHISRKDFLRNIPWRVHERKKNAFVCQMMFLQTLMCWSSPLLFHHFEVETYFINWNHVISLITKVCIFRYKKPNRMDRESFTSKYPVVLEANTGQVLSKLSNISMLIYKSVSNPHGPTIELFVIGNGSSQHGIAKTSDYYVAIGNLNQQEIEVSL